MAAKHFNKGYLFGEVVKIETDREKEDDKKLMATIELNCGNGNYGDVVAYCRMFGSNATKFLRWHRNLKGKEHIVSLEGVYGQWEKNDKQYSSFVAFDFKPQNLDTLRRATFILTGKLGYIKQLEGGDREVCIDITKESAGYAAKTETFRLRILKKDEKGLAELIAAKTDATVHVKGVLIQKSEQDLYSGAFTVPPVAAIKEAKVYE